MGTINGCGYHVQQKGAINFVMLMGCAERFKAHLREFFADFDLSVTLMSCSGAYRCQYLAILVMTIDIQNRLLYPLHMHMGYCIVRA